MKRPALFLDRDGVINVNHGHVHKIDNFDFIEGIFQLVKKANDLDMPVIIVTNQGGIGRGHYTEDAFYTLMNWVLEQFNKNNTLIEDVYFCPFHPEHGVGKYRRSSKFRKPEPGMILKAALDNEIDLSCSIMVGDKKTDMDAGEAAGVGTLFLLSNTEKHHSAQTISLLSEIDLKPTQF